MRIVALLLARMAWLVPTLAGLVAIVFFVSRVVPADPVALLAGETASREQVELLRAQLGLDRPLGMQLLAYYRQLLSGDLGTSLFTTRPVWDDLAARLPATIELTTAAMLAAVAGGIPLGVLAAIYRNRAADHALRILTVAGLAVASFWLALILQLFFAMNLGWLPLQGRISGFPPAPITGFYVVDALLAADLGRLNDVLAHLTLPALTLAFPALATIVRFTRAGVLETLQRNFIVYQRAMGIPAGIITWKYVLRNSLISTLTQIGLLFGILFAGAVVVETVFQWPGIGAYAFEAILHSDYAAVMGFTVYVGVVFGIINLIVDIFNAVLDPRGRGA
jgi:peptide/nickel transport system permease protein